MPGPAAPSSSPAPRENVHAVSRALAVLDAFHADEQGLSLAELSRRLQMEKSTLLRTARTLARSGYLAQIEDGRWRLGPACGVLGVRYQTSFDARDIIDSALRRLAARCGETAALFVPEDNGRTCVARVDKPSLDRHHIRVGEKLPLDKGASGHVLLAFAGAPGAVHEAVRRSGYYVSVSERDARMSSIAVPVFSAKQRLFGALCVSGTAEHLGYDDLLRHLKPLIASAAELSRALAANAGGPTAPLVHSVATRPNPVAPGTKRQHAATRKSG